MPSLCEASTPSRRRHTSITVDGNRSLLMVAPCLVAMSMTFTPDESPADAARRIIDSNSYATLATADADGRPWATPGWFAERGVRQFVWVSRTTRRHSQNVAQRAEI